MNIIPNRIDDGTDQLAIDTLGGFSGNNLAAPVDARLQNGNDAIWRMTA